MFKNIAVGTILALVVCTLVVHGAESNIQEVLEESYKQVASSVPDSLPVIATQEPAVEPATAVKQEPSGETSTTQCKCEQSPELPTRAEPELGKPAKSLTEDKKKACKAETAVKEEIVAAVVEDVSSPCQKSRARAVVEESQAAVQEKKAPEEEKVTEEQPVGKKSSKKEKNKKRSKRDTKRGKNKGRGEAKSKSKRSSESKSKSKDKKSRK